ncbi:Slc9a8 [Symbiodinium sp. CCMP2592]|nr:Slc9a8 [Symbiodinium sp. CCMP2592]
MAARPENIEEWLHLVPHLLSSAGWHSIAEAPSVGLCHCTCPWGGNLVKLAVLDLQVEHVPKDSARIMVRPETRAWGVRTLAESNAEQFAVLEQFAPGDAIVNRRACWKALRTWAVLLGDTGTEFLQANFFYESKRSQDDLDAEEDGVSVLALRTFSSLSEEPFEAVNFCRPQAVLGVVNVYQIFHIPSRINLSKWATAHWDKALEAVRRTARYYLNRPGMIQMRTFDQQCYIVLSIQSFKRGFPMLPVPCDEFGSAGVTTINAGRSMGLTTWARYDPAKFGSDRFLLSEYLKVFTKFLGEPLNFYQSLDGQELRYFQCVVAREDWSRVQGFLKDAYLLQKTAYRRANGGAQAPGLTETNEPRFNQEICFASLAERTKQHAAMQAQQKVLVRKTFIEREEDSDEEELLRSSRRCRTETHRIAIRYVGVA